MDAERLENAKYIDLVFITEIQVNTLIMLCLFQPSYAEFDISDNVLGLVFNQGMIW